VKDEEETVDKSGERKERPIDRVRRLAEEAGVPFEEKKLRPGRRRPLLGGSEEVSNLRR
jgi:hypothetical protein